MRFFCTYKLFKICINKGRKRQAKITGNLLCLILYVDVCFDTNESFRHISKVYTTDIYLSIPRAYSPAFHYPLLVYLFSQLAIVSKFNFLTATFRVKLSTSLFVAFNSYLLRNKKRAVAPTAVLLLPSRKT